VGGCFAARLFEGPLSGFDALQLTCGPRCGLMLSPMLSPRSPKPRGARSASAGPVKRPSDEIPRPSPHWARIKVRFGRIVIARVVVQPVGRSNFPMINVRDPEAAARTAIDGADSGMMDVRPHPQFGGPHRTGQGQGGNGECSRHSNSRCPHGEHPSPGGPERAAYVTRRRTATMTG
jgi:hypothetical protein